MFAEIDALLKLTGWRGRSLRDELAGLRDASPRKIRKGLAKSIFYVGEVEEDGEEELRPVGLVTEVGDSAMSSREDLDDSRWVYMKGRAGGNKHFTL
jgi:hypothetical protein